MMKTLFLNRRPARSLFCLLLSLLLFMGFPGCAEQAVPTEAGISGELNTLLSQMGKPIDEAFSALSLPGKPEDGVGEGITDKLPTGIYLEEAFSLQGRKVNLGLGRIGRLAPNETRVTAPVGLITLGLRFQDEEDAQYAVSLYQALQEAYGDPRSEKSSETDLSFSQVGAKEILSLQSDSRYYARWLVCGQVLELTARSNGVSINLLYPEYLYRPVFDESGELLGHGPYAYPAPDDKTSG